MRKPINDWPKPACLGPEFKATSPTRLRESNGVFVGRGGPSLDRPVEIRDPYPN